MKLRSIYLLCAICLTFAACAGSDAEVAPPAPRTLDSDTGKADGVIHKVEDYFEDNLSLPLSDLTSRASALATDGLNDLLAQTPYVDMKLSETKLFGQAGASTSLFEVTDLNAMVAGLTTRFGREDFVTQINDIRSRHISNSNDTIFAESEFEIGLDADGSFSTEAGDFDINIGFRPGYRVRATVVSAHGAPTEALLVGPLNAVSALRNFVLPRDVDDLKTMLPGESVTLSGEGVVGFNVGANLPIFSFDPIDHLVMTARFHLGARVSTEGDVDVNLIRGEGTDLFIDVGLSRARNRQYKAAFQSGYGLVGIPPLLAVHVAGRSFSLGDIAAELIKGRLDRIGLLDYGVQAISSNQQERISIQRFKVNLSNPSTDMVQAVEQAAGGDLRLIQTLADRSNSGIEQMMSFDRNYNQNHRHLGAHIASMNFYRQTTEREGVVVLDNGDEVRRVVFGELEENSGRFYREWGSRRQLLTSQTWANGRFVRANMNLRLAVSESDSFTKRDQILDHVDAALMSIIDFDQAYSVLTRKYEELQHEVDQECEECEDHNAGASCDRRYRECVEAQLSDEEVRAWRDDLRILTSETINELDPSGYQTAFDGPDDVANSLLELKLRLSSVKEIPALLSDLTGRTAILSDVRFTQSGLDHVFATIDPTAFDVRMREVLTLIVSKRSRDYDSKYARALNWLDGESDKIADMVSVFERASEGYRSLDSITSVRLEGNAIGNSAYVLTGDPNTENLPVLRTMSEQKGVYAARMVEDMIDRGRDLSLVQAIIRIVTLGLADTRGFESHHLIAYTLASLVPAESREWLMSMDFEEEEFADIELYTRGSREADFIGLGDFDLEFLTRN